MASQKHYRTCNLCEAMCGIEIEVDGEQILAIRGDQEDMFSRGHICPKAVALQDLHQDPDRLRLPVKRTAEGWQEISWAQALDETAERLLAIRDRYGRESVAFYAGNPTAHNHGALLMLVPFIRALGSRNRYSATSVDQLPHMLACLEMFGHQLLFPVPDIDHTDFFLVIGGNPVASNGSIMTAPDVRNRLKAIRARGGRLVVVDPRKTETAALADQHLFIRPGTDVFLLLGMLQVIFSEGLARPGRLAAITDGLDLLESLVKGWTPERVAGQTGIDAELVRGLARDFAASNAGSAYCRVGTTTSRHSGLSAWLVYALNIVTGNLDRRGGVMVTQPAFDVVALAALSGDTGGFDRYRSRVRQLPEFGGEFPVATLADEILTPGDGQVKALVTHAGNPVLSCPDGHRLDRALSGLDFMVSIDFYINETTRHADIILPPTGQLEHAQFDPVFHALAVRNTIKFSPPLFAPAAGAMHDWQILLALITRLSGRTLAQRLKANTTHALISRLGDRGLIDLVLRFGPYGQWRGGMNRLRNGLSRIPLGRWRRLLASDKTGDSKGLTLAKVEAAPHGIDLGPLQSVFPQRLFTADKRIRLAPPRYIHELLSLEEEAAPAADEFRLIGRRHVRSNNSWMHNSYRLVKGKGRCTAMLHPADAARIGIENGEEIEISSRVGSIRLPAEVTEDLMPGVISVPHGWGHARQGVQMGVAASHAGVSINDVISSDQVDRLTGTAILNGQSVTVRHCRAPMPEELADEES